MREPRVAIPPIAPAAFHRRAPNAPVVSLAGKAMGTTWHVLAVSTRPAAELRVATERALAAVVREMSHWEPTSHLSRFNAAPVGTAVTIPPDLATVMVRALEIAEASDGAFDPAAGRLVDLWGFGPPGAVARPPSNETIAAALPSSRHPGLDPGSRFSPRSEGSGIPDQVRGDGTVRLEGTTLTRTADVRLDLSGIAKGFAVDAVWRALAKVGVADALVEVGGELRGEGIRPDGQPWWVELETPSGHPAAPLRVALHGLAVATSGDYVRHWTHAGRRYAHTLDPRTGRPVDNGVVAVSVIAADAMTADAWATALHVLGPPGMRIAGERALAVRMLVRDAELVSPALAAMLGG